MGLWGNPNIQQCPHIGQRTPYLAEFVTALRTHWQTQCMNWPNEVVPEPHIITELLWVRIFFVYVSASPGGCMLSACVSNISTLASN